MKRIILPLVIVVALVAGICFVGCETESASENNLVISPAAATILLGETIDFNVSGGFTYNWSLEQESWGTLSATQGDRVSYTSLHDPGATEFSARQVITVTSTLGTDNAGSNSLNYVQSAEAIVTHETVETAVTISPANATVEEFGSVTFTASGAHTYSWSLQYESWGSLTARQGATTTYTSLHQPGSTEDLQILTCTTDQGTVTAHIIHDPEGVTITPSSVSLNGGGTVKLRATGGSVYSWSKDGSGAPFVSLSDTSGSEIDVTYSVPAPADEFAGTKTAIINVSSGDDEAQASVTIYGTL